MKKITLLLYTILGLSISWNSTAQILNQPANWPNLSWSIGGTYSSVGLINRPDSSINFTFDDDAAGFLSADVINAESPIIDLTSAFNGGENWITINGNYLYYAFNSDTLLLEYWDQDASSWVPWYYFAGNTTSPADFKSCSNLLTFSSDILNVTFFTPAQLSGFKYRFRYNDIGGWQWGFCFSSPAIVSSTPTFCPVPTSLSALSIIPTSVDLGWIENGSSTSWDIEWGTVGFIPTGTPIISGTTTNPHSLSGLTANTSYDFYVRSRCGGPTSNWVGPFTFTTLCTAMTFPYFENFDGVSPALPACWLTNNSAEVTTTSGCLGSTNESLQLNGLQGVYAYSPLIDVSAQSSVEVSYLYRAGDDGFCNNNPEPGDNMNVDYWNGTTWINLVNYDGGSSPIVFTPASFIITTGLTNSFRLRFEMQAGLGPGFDNYNFDNLEVKIPIGNDIRIVDIQSAAPGCNLGMEQITVKINNLGGAMQSNFDVGYSLNGTPISPEIVADTIFPGDTLTYTFTSLADMSSINTYNVDAWTDLTSDLNNSNDTLFGFSTENVIPSLVHVGIDTVNTFLGVQSVICTEGLVQNLLDSNYQLIGVVIDSFPHAWEQDVNMYLISPAGDTVELSTGNGLGAAGGYNNTTFTDTASISIIGSSNISNGYFKTEDPAGLAKFDGTDPNGAWILWVSDNLPSIDDGILYGWHLEFIDIISDINTIVKNNHIKIFPNPNNGLITLTANYKGINELKIELINMQGQVVFIKTIFDNIYNLNEQIDLTKYANGIYFVTITSDKFIETQKIVVQ